jgi:hypothetical protein
MKYFALKSLVCYKYKVDDMGQARQRAKEIEQLKKWGRLIDTPRPAQPVFVRVGDQVWMITNAEFADWVNAAHRITQPDAAQKELARLALIAERSGVKEAECQQWFGYQLKVYADAVLNKPMSKPIIMAQSHK